MLRGDTSQQTALSHSLLSTAPPADRFQIKIPPPPKSLQNRINPYLDTSTVLAPTVKKDKKTIDTMIKRLSKEHHTKALDEHESMIYAQKPVFLPFPGMQTSLGARETKGGKITGRHELSKEKIMTTGAIEETLHRLYAKEVADGEQRRYALRTKWQRKEGVLPGVGPSAAEPAAKLNDEQLDGVLTKLYHKPLERKMAKHPPPPRAASSMGVSERGPPPLEERQRARTPHSPTKRDKQVSQRLFDTHKEKRAQHDAKLQAKFIDGSLPTVPKRTPDQLEMALERLYVPRK